MSVELIGEVVVDGVSQPIQLDLGAGRIEIPIDGHAAFLTFHRRGSTLSLIHTEVPVPLREKGLAGALAKAALEYARRHSLKVKPFCPFVQSYLKRHPEFQDLVAPDSAPE